MAFEVHQASRMPILHKALLVLEHQRLMYVTTVDGNQWQQAMLVRILR